MRKHRSLGEMISTATFLGCGFHISIQHGIVRYGSTATRLYWAFCSFVLYSGWVTVHYRKSG